MSALYRRYRPTNFAEVIGQDHLRRALENSLKKDLIGHAYLFSGPRGTGKTTVARLLARAVNCEQPTDGFEPCGKCAICQEIGAGQSVDIIEIDAASNRGIDEIRELRDKIAYAPARSKYKVYIIDEVHMLTKEAFNALLKTLEEPPKHAIFILATTELHKVPDTIISRCQRYQFHRASIEAVTSILKDIAKKEKIKIDDAGLALVARRAEGSFRDALTLLGNLAAQEDLSAQSVRQLMGLPPSDTVQQLRDALLAADAETVKTVTHSVIQEGGDVVVLLKSVADELKEELMTSEKAENLAPFARLLEALVSALARARVSTDPTAFLVARLLTLTLPISKSSSIAAEPKPATVVPVAVTAAPPAKVADLQKVEKPESETPVAVDAVSEPKSIAGAGDFWSGFLAEVKNHNHALYAVIRSAQLADLTDDKVVIAVKFRFYGDRLHEAKNRRLIEKAASDVAGRALVLETVIKTDLNPMTESGEDVMKAVVDVFELEEAK